MEDNVKHNEGASVRWHLPRVVQPRRTRNVRRTTTRHIDVVSFKSDYTREIIEKCKGIEEILNVINADGSYLWKVRSSSKWFRRKFNLNIRDMRINYSPSAKNGNCCAGLSEPQIEIADISEVRRGWKTDIFNKIEARQERNITKARNNRRREVNEGCCFSIIYGERKDKTLDLVAPSQEIAEQWVRGIEHLLSWYESKKIEEGYELWLRKKFNSADSNSDKCLTFNETMNLLQELNIEMNEAEGQVLFNEANTKVSTYEGLREVLDEDEFMTLYFRLLQRPEIEELFRSYVSPYGAFGAKQLKEFLQKEQFGYENISADECGVLIQIYEYSDSKTKGHMTISGFSNMLLSPDFDIFNYKEHKHISQDMSQPLSQYYIASSHNTYIMGNQLSGKSSVEPFVDSLKRGCKCVEIDCWDGEDGEPVVWHGHTFVTKISFREVLEDAIKPYAFVASTFPLILSLEVHCSFSVRQKMASYLQEIFGDMLYSEDLKYTMENLPSPEDLQGKILIKAKTSYKNMKVKKSTGTTTIETRSEVNTRFTATDASEQGLKTTTSKYSVSTTTNVHKESSGRASEFFVSLPVPINEFDIVTSSNPNLIESDEEETEDDEPTDTVDNDRSLPIPREALCGLVNLIQAVKFHSFEESKRNGRCYEMSSFSESRAVKLIKETPAAFTDYNKRQLSRIYPAAKRAMSSNFFPLRFWRTGCQIVALNYQTQDIPNLINGAMFQQNGRCGYVLKPQFLRDPNIPYPKKFLEDSCQLTVRIISGQHLPKVDGSPKVVDPYVQFRVIGTKEDWAETKFETKTIQKNGFNPIWNETFQARVNCPELAFIYFRVRDHAQSGSDMPLGYYVAPFAAIATGYRHIRLKNMGGDPVSPSTLFVHISISKEELPA